MVSFKRGLEVYFNFYLRRHRPTIVYAMGRVGSVALFRSLYAHGEFALHVKRDKKDATAILGKMKAVSQEITLPVPSVV